MYHHKHSQSYFLRLIFQDDVKHYIIGITPSTPSTHNIFDPQNLFFLDADFGSNHLLGLPKFVCNWESVRLVLELVFVLSIVELNLKCRDSV